MWQLLDQHNKKNNKNAFCLASRNYFTYLWLVVRESCNIFVLFISMPLFLLNQKSRQPELHVYTECWQVLEEGECHRCSTWSWFPNTEFLKSLVYWEKKSSFRVPRQIVHIKNKLQSSLFLWHYLLPMDAVGGWDSHLFGTNWYAIGSGERCPFLFGLLYINLTGLK